jgi:hypothetical protein
MISYCVIYRVTLVIFCTDYLFFDLSYKDVPSQPQYSLCQSHLPISLDW